MAALNRRKLLLAGLSMPALVLPRAVLASENRRLRLHHTHTNENLDLIYRDADGYISAAIAELNHFLRDHRNGESLSMDPALFDILSNIYEVAGGTGSFQIISGYRSPETNEMLRSRSSGVAKNSLHTHGKAIDVRLPGVTTSELRDKAIEMGFGGVGYYAKSDFVHVDTGRVRRW